MKRSRPGATSDAAIALRIAHELEEDGDPEAARRCVEHAIEVASSCISGQARFEHATEKHGSSSSCDPPAALIASVGLATLGTLFREAGDLHESRNALVKSMNIWHGNATARLQLAHLELHHGSFERACQLYAEVAALPPIDAPPSCVDDDDDGENTSWPATLVAAPRAHAVAHGSYMHALLLHLRGQCDEAVPHLRRLGVRHRLAPAVWSAVAAEPPEPLPPVPWPASLSNIPDVARFSGAVPPALLRRLQSAFSPTSPFWEESNYAERGYFSFWYDLPPR